VSTSGWGTQTVALSGTGLSIFALSSNPTSATVTHSTPSATFNLSVTPQGGAFTNSVALSCSGLPTLSQCTFNPSSVTPGASPATSTLTIGTAAASASWKPARPASHVHGIEFALAVLGLCFFATSTDYKRRARRLALAIAASSLLALPSCGGSGSGGSNPPPPPPTTPPGTYSVTVLGDGATAQSSVKLTLTVQ
jgi:hypothetical protein